MLTKFVISSLVIVLSACVATGPADDGYENSNEWVNNGRLLSDDVKTVYRSLENQAEGMDYNAYDEWLKARESNTVEYQRFKQWQEFEQYHQWKQQSQ